MSETTFKTPFGDFELKRIPQRNKETLRAWDAADQLLLEVVKSKEINPQQKLLVINDVFGALTVTLNEFNPVNWSDSFISHQAVQKNSEINALTEIKSSCLSSMHMPEAPIDIVLLRIPKSMVLFEHQLIQLRTVLSSSSIILVAGMQKYMPKNVWALLEKILGATNTHLAQHKAKLIEVSFDSNLNPPDNIPLSKWDLEFSPYKLNNHANVFSRDHLDIGTRFFLKHLPATDGDLKIVDLACGNGVIGLMAADQNPEAIIHFCDESYMAVASAKQNLIQLSNSDAESRFSFECADGLGSIPKASVDLIVCNPPFHQNQNVGETVALKMFQQAAAKLRGQGELWVVCNRHLGYHIKLKSWFNHVTLQASNKKFVILKAVNNK